MPRHLVRDLTRIHGTRGPMSGDKSTQEYLYTSVKQHAPATPGADGIPIEKVRRAMSLTFVALIAFVLLNVHMNE